MDEILTKYVEALGGEAAIRKVTSRVITATQDFPTGGGGTTPVPAQTERYMKAPNLLLNIYKTNKFTVEDGFDGTNLWAQDVRGNLTEVFDIEQLRAKRSADFYESIHLKQEYTDLTVTGTEKVNNRDAYVVVGVPRDDSPEKLYFDTQTGLLVRKFTTMPTPIGKSPFQVDYDDYRDTGSGVKIAFVTHLLPTSPRTELGPHTTIQVLTVRDNVPIDDMKFVKPTSPVPSAR